MLLKLIWSFGIEFWESAKVSSANNIQIFQSRALRIIVAVRPYISNDALHKDTGLLTISQTAKLR